MQLSSFFTYIFDNVPENTSLNKIITYIKAHRDLPYVLLYLNNSTKFQLSFLKLLERLIDIQANLELTCSLVILIESNIPKTTDLVSRVLSLPDCCILPKSLVQSYLINQEIFHEKLRKFT